MDKEQLKRQLITDEGIKLFPYLDSESIWTIGVGRNLESKGLSLSELFFLGIKAKDKQSVLELLKKRGISEYEALYLLDNDVDEVVSAITRKLPWVKNKPVEVLSVLSNMAFNLGLNGLLEFKNTLAYLRSNKWLEASIEMLDSRWASQVGNRAIRLSDRVKKINK